MADEDLGSSLARQLTNGSYECMICCDKVRARHAIWQCDHCWAIFHVGCVKKWAKSCTGSDVGDGSARWRCPGCQYTRAAAPSHYVCFCGASRDPEPARGCVPHSCGRVCGKSRGRRCPHPCPLTCHPGPCPPCTAMAPEQSCFCGRLVYQPKCGSDYDPDKNIKSCGHICDETLGCGKHKCDKPCHPGLCPPCPRDEFQMCYCGRHTRTAKCGAGRAQPTFVNSSDGDEPQTGFYSCGDVCDELLGCGVHKCGRPCHPHADPAAGHGHGACALDPAVANTCHCGAALASELGQERLRCSDPVPSCGERCGHKLPGCGHTCNEVCHAGPCPPCTVRVKTPCRCRSKTFQTECFKARPGSGSQPTCQRVCGKLRVCGRHRCNAKCCASDHVDIDGAVIPSEDLAPGATDAHQCPLVCGRLLRCKIHACSQPCHRGPCPPCLEASFDELACACGRTRLYPPIACGTVLPPCHHPCTRVRACGHVSLMAHECHGDDVACPPCPVLVASQCMCGAREMKNIPCHRSAAASCGAICNRLLPCGGHRCQRSCHRPDEPCLRGGQACRQACGKPRKTCGHSCALACHSPAMCDESLPCEASVLVTCQCGRKSLKELCGSTAANGRSGARRIPCDDVCRIAMRNRRLALALDLPDKAQAPLAGLVKSTYADDLLQFARSNLAWVREIEAQIGEFVASRRP
ncbi:FKBP12-associated protein, partial [Linderina macrospora]